MARSFGGDVDGGVVFGVGGCDARTVVAVVFVFAVVAVVALVGDGSHGIENIFRNKPPSPCAEPCGVLTPSAVRRKGEAFVL